MKKKVEKEKWQKRGKSGGKWWEKGGKRGKRGEVEERRGERKKDCSSWDSNPNALPTTPLAYS